MKTEPTLSTSEPTSELVLRAAAQDFPLSERHRAFGALVLRFQDMVFGCAYSLCGNAATAEDAAQEAFLLAWHSLNQLRDADAFPGWLKRIVVRQCRRTPRDTGHLPLNTAQEFAAPTADEPLAHTIRAEHATAVREAIAALPENERMVTLLFYINDYSRAEVGAFLGISPVMVKKRLASARTRLHERLLTLMQDDLHELRPSHDTIFAERVLAFTKLFSGLVDSGLSLTASLEKLAEQENDTELRDAILQIRADLLAGSRLSHAMEKYPRYFPEPYLAVIREGEYSGELEVALERLAGRVTGAGV
jgi:RNA polymerase sigma factor (sigma-70 family)